MRSLRLTVKETVMPRFYRIIQAGFFIKTHMGESVMELLCGQFELTEQYIDEKVSTLFLDNKPVDNIREAIIREGSTMALSSAMPGLVGAAMRRQGFYAPLRSAIAYDKKERLSPDAEEKYGLLRVKLFNVLMKDLGLPLLKKGVYLRTMDFVDFLATESESFFEGCVEVLCEGDRLDPLSLKEPGWSQGSEWVFLEVNVCK